LKREFSDFFESNKSSSRIAKTTFLTPFEGYYIYYWYYKKNLIETLKYFYFIKKTLKIYITFKLFKT
jgi:hypothetical protein